MEKEEIYNINLRDLNLNSRINNVFRAANVRKISGLLKYKEKDLLGFRYFGPSSLYQLYGALENLGLHEEVEKMKDKEYSLPYISKGFNPVFLRNVLTITDKYITQVNKGKFRKELSEIKPSLEQLLSVTDKFVPECSKGSITEDLKRLY